MTEAFSRVGIGGLLGDMFDRAATSRTGAFPDVERRGETLLMVADFGGQHKGQHFDTYAFLILDLDRNEHWLTGQRAFRRTVLPNSRRMSFKTMNDGQRRQALLPFLRLADRIEGWLVLFAVSKVGGSLFSRNDSTESKDLLASWKPRVRERLLRIIHLSAFLLSGLSSPGQDLLWLIDKDEIASNSDQLRQLTAIFGRVSSSLLNHDLRHIKCGTTQSEDGTLSLEDLVAVSDLAAGAFAEVTTAMSIQGGLPRRRLVTALPTDLTWKSSTLATWLAAKSQPLRRLSCLLELSSTSSSMRATMMQWHALPGRLWLPRHSSRGVEP